MSETHPTAPSITAQVVAEHGLKPDEYDRLLEIMGREPSLTELGIFSVISGVARGIHDVCVF